MSPELRSAIYTLGAAVIALAVGYGLLTEEQAALWVAALTGLVSTVVAYLNRPTKA